MYENISDSDFSGILNTSFNREAIADDAKAILSKESQIDRIVNEIKQ